MDDGENDGKDDSKRKSRNLSEKKRRDQFNMLVNELGCMVSTDTRRMDKSTVLKSTILFLKNHKEIAVKSRIHEIEEDWKPSFLSNEEFTHLILEALDGFIMVFSSNGRIYYASESVTSLLGYLPSELANATLYEIAYDDDQSSLYNVFLNRRKNRNQRTVKEDNKASFTCHIKKGCLDGPENNTYVLVQFIGYFRSNINIDNPLPNNKIGDGNAGGVGNDSKLVFVGSGRLRTPRLIRDIFFVDAAKSEFSSRHSLEWKFLFLDHRAPPIIGYLPFELLGTSGYDYYHVDDLRNVVTCHQLLMEKGKGTSCHYRFLTKGQQWIWLQTTFYIDYNQSNSKPEFIVCTHNVVSYANVINRFKKNITTTHCDNDPDSDVTRISKQPIKVGHGQTPLSATVLSPNSSESSNPPVAKGPGLMANCMFDGTSISVDSQSSRHSVSTIHSPKPIEVSRTSSGNSIPQQLVDAHIPRCDDDSVQVDRLHRDYVEPILSVVPIGFPAPGALTVPISLPNSTLVHKQNLMMTTAQNQIQNELQRKHEELQQLIVHQQGELKRVSEQLLIARYGLHSLM